MGFAVSVAAAALAVEYLVMVNVVLNDGPRVAVPFPTVTILIPASALLAVAVFWLRNRQTKEI